MADVQQPNLVLAVPTTHAALRLEGEALTLLNQLKSLPFDDAWLLLMKPLREAHTHG